MLEGNETLEVGVGLTPGEGDIAMEVSARYLDSGVKIIAQESRLAVRYRVEWRSRWRTRIV